MDIRKILKPGKDIVIEIEDVEYLLDDKSVSLIEQNNKKVSLIQLYDRQSYLFDIETVLKAIEKDGVTDYLDKIN